MKIDIKKLFGELGLPVALAGVFVAVLAVFGVEMDRVVEIASQMVGVWALVSILIEVLKYTGAVNDGDAGRWSAALHLLVLAVIAYLLIQNPQYDFVKLDAEIDAFARFALIIFGYAVNIAGSKGLYGAVSKGFGLKQFKSQG